MRKVPEKKEIEENLYLYVEAETILCGSLNEVANNIIDLEEKLKRNNVMAREGNYIRFNIRVVNEYNYDSSSMEVKLYGIRMETDEEFEERLFRNKKAIEAQNKAAKRKAKETEKREHDTYLRLHKKYNK